MNLSPSEQYSCFPSAHSLYTYHLNSKESVFGPDPSAAAPTVTIGATSLRRWLAPKKTLAIASLCYIIYIHRITVGPFTQPLPPLKLHPNPHHDTLNIPTHHPTSQHLQNSHPSPKLPLTTTGNISPKSLGNLTHSLPGWLGWRKKR